MTPATWRGTYFVTSGRPGSTMYYIFAGFNYVTRAMDFAEMVSKTHYPCYVENIDGKRLLEFHKGMMITPHHELVEVLKIKD